MSMSGMSAMTGRAMTTTGTASAASATGDMSMGGMGGMDMGNGCKINMLWNWYTVDACFISESWQITSKGMFAGSCIGVILLVMTLELLRRATKEYDRYIVAQHIKKSQGVSAPPSRGNEDSGDDAPKNGTRAVSAPACAPAQKTPRFRPNVFQQAIRALLHMLQFAVAYFVMLLAMYYNGYIIICIFIGAYLGSFIFQWETFSVGAEGRTTAAEEATVCCG